MNDKPETKIGYISPLKRICMTIGELPTSYLESMTYYEMLVWFVEFLKNKVIPVVNNNSEATEELQNLFEELQDYVNNYFDNLDVQEEIDNKLDEMAQSGELENIIKDYLETKCEFIFPGRWGYNTSCNCNLMKYKNKVFMFDTGSVWAYNNIKLMMINYDISHIDYVILSHFDLDHRGNLQSLIQDGYIDENSIYYHPSCPSQIYAQSVIDWYNEIESLCELRNIQSIIPNENEIVTVTDDLKLRFGNVNENYTVTNYTNANQASMVVEINHNNFKSLITGDAQYETLKHLYEINFINGNINFYTIPHHAINTRTYTRFYDIISPKMAVAQTQMVDYVENKCVLNQDSAILCDKNCINYYSFNNTDDIYFIEQFGNILCVNGIPNETIGKSQSITNIYVDASTNVENKQDGTLDHPYRDLSQAISSIKDYNNRHINILLAPGHYGNLNDSTTNEKNRINIINWKNSILITSDSTEGERIIDDGILVENCFKVKFENLTIKTTETRNYCVNIVNSNVYINNCIFTNYNQESKGLYGLLINEFSNCNIRGCSFSYLSNAISCRDESNVDITTPTFSNLTRIFDVDTTAKVYIHSISSIDYETIENINNYNVGIHALSFNDKTLTITNTKMLNVINLPFKINNIFENIEFEYELRYANNQVGRGRKTCSLSDLTSFTICDFNLQANGSLKLFSCFINISYTNGTLTISRNTTGSLDNGVMTTHAPTDEDTDDYGVKIKKITLF